MQDQTRPNPTVLCPTSLRCHQPGNPGRAQGAVRAHYPRGNQAISDPLLCTQTGWLHSRPGRAAVDGPQGMFSAPQGHTVLPAGNSGSWKRHRWSCADTASCPPCTVLTHPGHFPTVWRRNWWRFIFLQASSQLKAFLKLAGALSPSLPWKPHFSGELWEFTLPHDSGSPRVAFAKASCGITSAVSLLGRDLCVTALSLAVHHIPFGNCS